MGSGDEHWRRVERLEQLGGGQSDGAVLAELTAVLIEDEKECWHTKTAAIRSLVALKGGGAAILKTLARDPDPDVRQSAIEALGALGFAQAGRLLRQIAADDSDPLRTIAAQALTQLSSG